MKYAAQIIVKKLQQSRTNNCFHTGLTEMHYIY